MEDYKGKLLNFDEVGFKNAVRTYTPVLAAINQVAEIYEALDRNFKFNDAVFQDIVKNRCVNIKQQYQSLINEQVEASKFTFTGFVNSIKQNVSAQIEALELAVEAMFQAQYQAGISDFSNIGIIDGKAILTEAGITLLRAEFEERIRSNDQNTMYNLCLQLCADYESLYQFLKEKTNVGSQKWPLIGNTMNSVFEENGYGKLLLQKNVINLVK